MARAPRSSRSTPAAAPRAEPEVAAEKPARRPHVPTLASLTSDVRTLALNAFILATVVLLVPVIAVQFFRNEVIIEPIAVPEVVQAAGLTPEIASKLLADALVALVEEVGRDVTSVNVIPLSQKVDFSIPDSGLSIDSLVYYVRQFFGVAETRIGGEFRCGTPECGTESLVLRLRLTGRDRAVIQLDPRAETPEDAYFEIAATQVLANIDPFVAIAAQADTNPGLAATLARQLIRTRQPQAEFAHNLLGNILGNEENYAAAIDQFRAALAIRPDFTQARLGLGRALTAAGRLEDAEAVYAELNRSAPENAQAAEGLADLRVAQGRAADAMPLYLEAADRDPRTSRYYTKAGRLALESADAQTGVVLLGQALEADPADELALFTLADHHFNSDEFLEAAPVVRAWAGYAPDNPEARRFAAVVERQIENYPAALEQAEAALRLRPGTIELERLRSDILLLLERHEDAIALLEPLVTQFPEDSGLWYDLARHRFALGDKAGALDAYRLVVTTNADPASIDAMMADAFVNALSAELAAEKAVPSIE
jgi:predicted Zn-dependent protease